MSTPRDPASPDPRRRASLTRESIVGAAADLVDEEGVDALSMRAVAARLGAGTMSLYRHVASRDELLDLVLQRFVAAVPVRAVTDDWRADLRALARDVRAALVQRPHLTVLLTTRAAAPGGLAAVDRSLGILRRAGLAPREAVRANHALGNLVAGAALWEAAGFGGARGQDRARAADAAAAAISGKAGPPPVGDGLDNVAWAADELFAGSVDDRFEAGLDLLVAGIEARLAR